MAEACKRLEIYPEALRILKKALEYCWNVDNRD